MKERTSNEIRRAIYRRDGYQCAVCGDPRRLQCHHIEHRSQGGGNDQMNLITLCPICHALAHDTHFPSLPNEYGPDDVKQAIAEYMADYYAGLGVQWPTGESLLAGVKQAYGRASDDPAERDRNDAARCYCPTCGREGCIHREAFRRLPESVGGLGLCPGWVEGSPP